MSLSIKPSMFKPLEDYSRDIPTRPWIARATDAGADEGLCLCMPVTLDMLQAARDAGRICKEKYTRISAVGFLINAYLYRNLPAMSYDVVVVDQAQGAGIMAPEENISSYHTFEEAFLMLEGIGKALNSKPEYKQMFDELEAKKQDELKAKQMVEDKPMYIIPPDQNKNYQTSAAKKIPEETLTVEKLSQVAKAIAPEQSSFWDKIVGKTEKLDADDAITFDEILNKP